MLIIRNVVSPIVVITYLRPQPTTNLSENFDRCFTTISPDVLLDLIIPRQPWGGMHWKYHKSVGTYCLNKSSCVARRCAETLAVFVIVPAGSSRLISNLDQESLFDLASRCGTACYNIAAQSVGYHWIYMFATQESYSSTAQEWSSFWIAIRPFVKDGVGGPPQPR